MSLHNLALAQHAEDMVPLCYAIDTISFMMGRHWQSWEIGSA